MTYDVTFWRPADSAAEAAVEEVLQWIDEAELEPLDPSELGHNLFRLLSPCLAGLAPFDQGELLTGLSRLTTDRDEDEAPLLTFVVDETGARWGDASLFSSMHGSVLPALITALTRAGLCVWDPQREHLHPPCPARRMWLDVDTRDAVADPSLADVLSALEDLDEGSFAILESTQGDYVQTLREGASFRVEWRRTSESGAWRHFVAGLRGDHEVQPVPEGPGDLRPHEQLDLEQVQRVFSVFLERAQPPGGPGLEGHQPRPGVIHVGAQQARLGHLHTVGVREVGLSQRRTTAPHRAHARPGGRARQATIRVKGSRPPT